MEPTELTSCFEQREESRSDLHRWPALHSASAHSDPEPSELEHLQPAHLNQEPFAGLTPAARSRPTLQRQAEQLVLRAGLIPLERRQAAQQLATPAREAAGTLTTEQGPHKELHTTKKHQDASTHQSFGQYPSLCAIQQQRGSFQSGIGGSAFMVNHPDMPGQAPVLNGVTSHCAHNPLV